MIDEKLLELNKLNDVDRIGVMLSGGMDSALLLYLLGKHTTNEIKCFTVKKHDGADLYVDGIVDWINIKLQKNIPYSFRVGNPNLHHEQIIVNALYLVRNECEVVYLAGNKYPENILPNGPRRIRVGTGKSVRQPFFDYFKTDILRTYVHDDILDLLQFTHTCTEQCSGRCNVCWQCKERQWAFNELGLKDISIL